ncbi:MAG: 23S rRNA (guanosine(2251)-2'-O)-methyltransferase RlmB [bacterium]
MGRGKGESGGRSEKIAGLHAVESALRNDPARVLQVSVRDGRRDRRLQEILQLARQAGVKVSVLDGGAFSRQAAGLKHQGVFALYEPASTLTEKELPGLLDKLDHPPLLLILDGVTDPHNLGACLRTADAAGVDAVIVPRDNAVSITPVVRKVASGAAEVVPFVQVTNLSRMLDKLRESGVWLVGTSDKAEHDIFAQDMTGPLGLIMGAEGKGMRRLTAERCDFLVSIPMQGHVSSLNISVATGVCLYESLRQRRLSGKA